MYKRFYMTNKDIKDPALSKLITHPSRMLVWDWMKRKCTAGNNITIVHAEVAKELNYSKVTMWKVFKGLEELGFIVKNGKHGTTNIYMLNPNYCWTGSAESHEAGQAEFLRLKQGLKCH